MIKSNKGAALIIVVVTLAVLLIFITSSISISSSAFSMSQAERRFQSAYYVAEAGVRHQIEHIRTRFERQSQVPVPAGRQPVEFFYGAFTGSDGHRAQPLVFQNFGNDIARAEINWIANPISGDTRRFEFRSNGRVGNTSRSIRSSFTINFSTFNRDLLDFAVFSLNRPEFGGSASVLGDVGTNAPDVGGADRIIGDIETNMNVSLPPIDVPDDLLTRTNLTIPNNHTETVSDSGFYNRIEVGGTLTFNLGTAASPSRLYIVVNELVMNTGTINTIGEGQVFMFVTGSVSLNGNDHINIPQSRARHMAMLVTGSSIYVGGNAYLAGLVYAPGATLTVARGNVEIFGSMIVSDVDMRGNSTIEHTAVYTLDIEPHLVVGLPILTVETFQE